MHGELNKLQVFTTVIIVPCVKGHINITGFFSHTKLKQLNSQFERCPLLILNLNFCSFKMSFQLIAAFPVRAFHQT